ncbi:hypothetical protein ACQ4WP_02520 [Janthinobacterium sp. GB4P2]|uniref:hypothetical protein n=1 Tax=Janthinobacterium sp. GB4P2 TaxID=3424189 RepID=UPI003F22F678
MTRSRKLPPRLSGAGFRGFSLLPLAISFVVLVCLSLLAIQLCMTLRAREVQLNEAARESSNLAQSVAQHAYDTIKRLIRYWSHWWSGWRQMVFPIMNWPVFTNCWSPV